MDSKQRFFKTRRDFLTIFTTVEAKVEKGGKTFAMKFYLLVFDTGSRLYLMQAGTTLPVGEARERQIHERIRSLVAKEQILGEIAANLMAERPPIQATGRIVEVHEAGRLYRVEMANGHRAYAIIERKGPRLSPDENALGREVTLHFSPFDMSKCRLVAWQSPASDR